MIVAFSGHRPDKLGGYTYPNPIYTRVCQRIDAKLRELKPEKVISGMALGVDQWAAYIAHKLKIPFTAAIPFEKQDANWPSASKKAYNTLLKLAVEHIIVSPGSYSVEKMQVRNEWMVNNCDILIAVWNGSSGGTNNCINYAKSIGKEIIFINPQI